MGRGEEVQLHVVVHQALDYLPARAFSIQYDP